MKTYEGEVNIMKTDWMITMLQEICKNGDTYLDVQTFFRYCVKHGSFLGENAFWEGLKKLVARGDLHLEGNHVYLESVWQNEETAAKLISKRLLANPLESAELPLELCVGDIILTEEQRCAVKMALSNRISCILGGAGSGKTTLIRAIIDHCGYAENQIVLCAPTGKAAQNLREKTGFGRASTIHRVLLLRENSMAYPMLSFQNVRLVIIDESSMLTLKLMAKLLNAMSEDARMVLLGDPNQLPAVGAGNILPDLCRIGVPALSLECNHRQSSTDSALLHNVCRFGSLTGVEELQFDDSFVFREASDQEAYRQIMSEVARCHRRAESVQVLTPRRDTTLLSVAELNRGLQEKLNPAAPDKATLERSGGVFRCGDSVMVTRNDATHNCFNGDVGRIRISTGESSFCITMPDGRCPQWREEEIRDGLNRVQLAYAITIHKSQGSEFDTALVALPQTGVILTRNLLYTAISRAKHRVILYGTMETLEKAMETPPRPRASKLPEKTLGWLEHCA